MQDLTEATARAESEGYIGQIPPYPDTFAGRGLVICGGGVTYFTSAWVSVNLLRHLGCTLPIQLWHLGPHEVDPFMEALIAPLGVECVDGSEVRQRHPARILRGWELKSYAVLHCPFEEVLFLDADNLAITNPEALFETRAYQETGALFWPDLGRLDQTREIWQLCGVDYQDEPEFESGQFVVDKKRCWEALCLTMWYNEHSDFFYRYVHGDKETFHMAFRRLQKAYCMPTHPVRYEHNLLHQYGFDGTLQFQHQKKWNLFTTQDAQHLVHGPACFAFLQQLRECWDGRIGITVDNRSFADKVSDSSSLREGLLGFANLPGVQSRMSTDDIARLLPASGRRTTTTAALSLLAQSSERSPLIVEIGTMRDTRPDACASDGWSTLGLAWFVGAHGGTLHVVDNAAESLQCSRSVTRPIRVHIHFHQRDGATFLREFDRPIDLLYLDAWPSPSAMNTARYLDAYRRMLNKPKMVLIDDVDEGHLPAMALQLISEGYGILAHDDGLLALTSPQVNASQKQIYSDLSLERGSDMEFECAVITVNRPAGYVYDTVDALVKKMPLRLLVGSPDDEYVARYLSHPAVTIVETSAKEWEKIERVTLQQRASWNYRRALLPADEAQNAERDLLLFEDDILLAEDWQNRLRKTLEAAQGYIGSAFVLSLYTAWDFLAEAVRNDRLYVHYPYDQFYGAQGLYYPASLRLPFADYLQVHAVERNEVPLDHALRDFCHERAIPLLQCAPCLVQHQGRQSTGLGFWHCASQFTSDVAPRF